MPASAQKIVPNIWFDKNAEEAINFYVSAFKNSSISNITRYTKAGFEFHGMPEGTVMTIDFELNGYRFVAINGGPHFKPTPATSFFVECRTADEVTELWDKLLKDGAVLMEIGNYPWSERYGWIQDKYGISWQLIVNPEVKESHTVSPSLMFVGDQNGRAEEAMKHYTSIFSDSKIGEIARYTGEEGETAGHVMHASFTIHGQSFSAMDSSYPHAFGFSGAVSFLVECDSQKEIDYFWDKLSEGGDPSTQQCGWLGDKFGVTWQVAPTELNDMLLHGTPKQIESVTNAFMPMKKFDLAELRRVYEEAGK